MVTHMQAKPFAGTRGGGGGNDILKKCFRIPIYRNVKVIVLTKIVHL